MQDLDTKIADLTTWLKSQDTSDGPEYAKKWDERAALLNKKERILRSKTVGDISDGWHTFDELYEYRMLYNAAFFNELINRSDIRVMKSWRHSDGELCFGKDNYFVVVPHGFYR